ncbi:MAG TPA: hypothetical protein VFA18_07190 [Gemmataceae bacterium]|nr:hypothetical protein [Gemmataceae bacterium]
MPRGRCRIVFSSVSRTGAEAGAVLEGMVKSNAGMRIRIHQRQARRDWGPIEGPFEILEAGDNIHAETLAELVGQRVDAVTLLQLTRRQHPNCINIVNANIVRNLDVPASAVRPVGAGIRSGVHYD